MIRRWTLSLQQEGRILRQGNQNPKVNIFRYVTENTFDSYSWQLIENKQKFIGQIMTSKSPVRSCEDIDETALSYAEVKALATGNVYIKEKMDLEIQVSKLKLLKANHTSQRYRLEDAILKQYPKQLAFWKERKTGYQADIQTYEKSKNKQNQEFLIKIGNQVFLEKKEAGIALLEQCKSIRQSNTAIPIGEFCGFSLNLSWDSFSMKYSAILKGALSHVVELGTDAIGNMQRISNVLESMAERKQEVEQNLSNIEHQLATAQIEVTKPFPREMELKEKLERLHELNALLNLEEKGNQNVILEEEEKEVSQESAKKEEVFSEAEELSKRAEISTGANKYNKKEETSVVAEALVSWNSSSRVSESQIEYQVQQKETEKLPSKISVKEQLTKMKAKAFISKETRNKEVRKKQEPCL